jgi:hypothetical protein
MVFEKQSKRTVRAVINEIVDRTNTNTQRLRIVEQDSRSQKSRLNSAEQNLLSQKKTIGSSIADFEKKLENMDERLIAMESEIKEIVNEIKKLASLPKVRELETMIEIFNPMKSQFVTREEVEKLMEKKMKQTNKGKSTILNQV